MITSCIQSELIRTPIENNLLFKYRVFKKIEGHINTWLILKKK